MHIVSRDGTPFENRTEAGTLLAGELQEFRDEAPVVLGIPRGGLVVAHALAHSLSAPLDAIFAIKLGFPGNPEFAVGALSEGGGEFLSEDFIARMGITAEVAEEKARQAAELARRAGLIRRHLPRVPLEGRTVIVTDDGVATGATARAAFRAVRSSKPRHLVAAIPVGDEGAVEKLSEETDGMLCLRCPRDFRAVSQFYRSFPQVTDEEMEDLLRRRHADTFSPSRASKQQEGR
jgi:predicted phosphoribosyltransferase